MKLQLYMIQCKVVVSYIPIQFKKLLYFIRTLGTMILTKLYRSRSDLDPL